MVKVSHAIEQDPQAPGAQILAMMQTYNGQAFKYLAVNLSLLGNVWTWVTELCATDCMVVNSDFSQARLLEIQSANNCCVWSGPTSVLSPGIGQTEGKLDHLSL